MRGCWAMIALALALQQRLNAVPVAPLLRGAAVPACSNVDVAERAWDDAFGEQTQAKPCLLQRGQRLVLDPAAVSSPVLNGTAPGPPHALVRSSVRHARGVANATATAPYAVHVSAYLIRDSWCASPCYQPSWEMAAPKPPPGGSYQLLEAAIWIDEGRVALYEFDPGWADRTSRAYFDICDESHSCASYFAHREAKRLYQAKFDQATRGDSKALSAALRDAFAEVMKLAFARQPEHVVFTFSGHGGNADGGLFEGHMSAEDSGILLTGLPKKISLLNFGGNCAEGRYNLLAHMAPFADYLIASDLNVQAVSTSSLGSEEAKQNYMSTRAKYDDLHYLEVLLSEQMPIKEAALKLMDGWRIIWDSAKVGLAAAKLRQTKAVFDCAQVAPFASALKDASAEEKEVATAATEAAMCDVQAYVEALGKDTASTAWSALRIGFASTQDLFTWDPPVYGLGFNFLELKVDADGRLYKAPPCDVAAVE